MAKILLTAAMRRSNRLERSKCQGGRLVLKGGGQSRVTIVDIARAAGVSKSTVSLVLQGSPLVKPDKHDKVREAIQRLGYVYHRGAANLRRSVSDVVGLVINDLTNPFFAEMTVGLEAALQTAGLIPFLANTGESPTRQALVMRAMREHGAVGYVLCPAIGTNADDLAEVRAWGLPVTTVMRRLLADWLSSVTPDNVGGARRATEHLLWLGHRRIAFVGGRVGMVVHEERRAGWETALRQAGLPLDPALAVESTPNRDGGAVALQRVMSLADPPTAALCFNDVVAIGVIYALNGCGLAAGRDFAVVGFDDIADARLIHPPLTTVAVESRRLGEHAATILLEQLAGTAAGPQHITGDARLIVRASCGAAGAPQPKAA
jgi:LacI family transcriptional regulator